MLMLYNCGQPPTDGCCDDCQQVYVADHRLHVRRSTMFQELLYLREPEANNKLRKTRATMLHFDAPAQSELEDNGKRSAES